MRIGFGKVLLSEIQKTKNTWGLTLSLLGPLGVTIIMFLAYVNNAENASNAVNPWLNYGRYTYNFYFLLYPLFAALVAFLLSNVEHKNRGFKHLFTLPSSKANFYISKMLILLFWIGCSLIFATGILLLSGNLLGLIFPAYGFQEYQITNALLIFPIRMYISLLSIMAIHFFMSLYWDNFIISVGSSVFLLVLGLVVFGTWKYAYLFPYSFPLQHWMEAGQGHTKIITRETWVSLTYALLFFSGGYLLMARKDIT